VGKHLIDLDEDKLGAARAELGTTTIKDTVNEALGLATSQRECRVAAALDMRVVYHDVLDISPAKSGRGRKPRCRVGGQ